MRSHLPPILIDGFDHPHALTGIPPRQRPVWGHTACPTCRGRGARNDMLHLDSLRCRIAGCDACDGSGWLTQDGTRHRADIVLVDGAPAWTITITPHIVTPASGRDMSEQQEPELAEAA